MAKDRLSKLQKAILLALWKAQNQASETTTNKNGIPFPLFKKLRGYGKVYIINIVSGDFYGQYDNIPINASVSISRSMENLNKKELIKFVNWGYLEHILLTEKGKNIAKNLVKNNP